MAPHEKKKRIVVADSDPSSSTAIGVILESADFDVNFAFNWESLLDSIREERPLLIILNVAMERPFAGKRIEADLKTLPEFKDLPVLLFGPTIDLPEGVARPRRKGKGIVYPQDLIRHVESLLSRPAEEPSYLQR